MRCLRLPSFRSLLIIVPLLVTSACAPKESGLRVSVKVRTQGTARVRADCIKLTVSNDTQELKSATIKRPADDDAIFGVRKGSDLPTTVKLQASGFIGANCADDASLKLNAQGDVVVANFPESGVTEVEVFVDPPGATLDVDRDGFVAASKGGLDCNDADNTVFPGALQVCANTADTDCDGQGGCDDSECGGATVCLDPPTRVVVTTQVNTMLRYECRGPFQVELRNLAGPRVAIRDTQVALVSSLAGVTVHGTSSCGDAAVTSLPIRYGQTSFEVWLKADGQAFGPATLTATADRVAMPGTAMVEVHPQPLDHLEFTTPARTVTAGQCSAELVTVEFRDAMNRRTDVDAPTTITMSSTPGDFMNANIFFSDDTCATPSPMGQLMPGQGQLALHVKVSRAGTFSLTATPSAGTGQSQALTVSPSTGTKLHFANTPIALNTTQNCSAGLFVVELRDAFDNPVNSPVDLPIRISVSGLVNITFYEAAGNCTSAAQTDFTIPAGSSTVSFRARGMTAPPNTGTLQAVVLNGAPIAADTQMVTISAGFASKFRLTGNPTNPPAGQCSQNPFAVELLDSTGNPAQAAGNMATPFTLSTQPASTDPSFRFYAGPGCVTPLTGPLVVPAGSSSATFSYQGNKAVANFEIRATSALAPPPTFLPNNSIVPGPPGKLVFTTPLTQSAQAGSCTPGPYVANVLDLFDNVTSFATAQVVSVSSTPTVGTGVTVGATTCASGNTVALAAGATQTSFTAQHTTTGSYALTATVNGFSTATPATLTVTPGPSTLQVDTPTGTATLTAGACQVITVSRRDNFGNAAPVSGTAAVTVTQPPSTTWVVYSSNNCTTGAGAALSMTNTHTLTFSVSPRTSGAQALTVAIPSVSQQAIVNFQVNAGAPTLVFSTPATLTGTAAASQIAGGCTPVTVVRRDAFGNDVPLGASGSVTFTLPTGTTVHTATPCAVGNAISSLPLTSTDASASFFVSATKSSPTGGPQPQSVGISLAAQTATLTLTVSPSTPTLSITLPVGGTAALLAHQCQRVNVERRDVYLNLVPASGSPLTVTPTAADLQTFVSTNCTGTANTSITVTAGASTRDFSLRLDTAGPAARALTVTLDGQTAPLSLTISPEATSQFVVQGVPATAISGACIGPLSLRRRDAYGNDTTSGAISVAMTSSQFMFSNAADCSGATAGLSVAIADASAVSGNFYATAALAGTATMTATQGTSTGNASATINPGPPAQLAFTTPPRTFIANACGGAPNVITVQLRDAAGNVTNALAGGQAFTAVSTSAGGTWWTNAGCTTASGTGAFTIPVGTSSLSIYYRDTTVGTPDISLTSALSNPAAQTHTVTVGPPTQLAFTTNPRTFTAAQCPGAANVITVQLRDAVGNPVNAGAGGQAFTASSNSTGTVTWYTDDVCTSTSATGAFTIPAGSNSVALYYKDTKAGSINISLANASSLTNPAPQSHTVAAGAPYQLVFTSSSQTVPALGCSAQVTVTMQDLGGNVVNAGSSRVITFSATPGASVVTFYTNASCGTAMGSSQQTMAANASTVTGYFKAENAGPITLFADSPLITQGSQAETIGPADVASLSITTLAATIDAGFCQAISVDRLDGLGRPATGAATVVTPTLAAGALLFSDSTCTTALGSTFNIPAGASTATIYLKGLTGSISSGNIPGTQAYTLTLAATGVTSVNVVMTVRPMVRRGSCSLTGTSVTCAITPTLSATNRTFLLFQAAAGNADDTAADDNVTCRLNPNGGTAQVVCDRVGNAAAVPIEWQTVTFPYDYGTPGGATVQHVSGSCTASTTPMPLAMALTPSVTVANSFVLFSSRSGGGNNNGDHFFTAQLAGDGSGVTINQNAAGNCTTTASFEAQVVSWQGSTVVHGVTAGGSGASFAPNTPTSGPTFLLYSSRMTGDTTGGDTPNICRRRLKGDITSGTAIAFTRGCVGADIQDIAWETVRMPSGSVAAYALSPASASATTSQTLPAAVDLTRTVSFIGGQGQGGSASGSTTYSGSDRVGAAQARVVLTSTTNLALTRGSGDVVGSYTVYVMQLTP